MNCSDRVILAQADSEWVWPAIALSTLLIAVLAVAFMLWLLKRLRREHQAAINAQTRVRLMLEQLPAGIWTVDNEFRFTSVDGLGFADIGETPAHFLGKTIYEYFQTKDRAFKPIAGHEDVIRNRKPIQYEIVWRDRTYTVHLEPWKDEAGAPLGALGVSFDITARKKAEHALQATEARSRALLTAIPDVMFRMRSDGTVLEFMDKLAGPPLSQSGQHIRLIYPDKADQVIEQARSALATGQVQIREYTCPLKTRDNCFEARFVTSGKDEVLVIVRNITERKKAENDIRRREAELQSLVRAIPDLLFLTTRDGLISGLSAHNEADLLAPPDQVIGRHFRDFLPERISSEFDVHLKRAQDTGEAQVFQYPLDFSGEIRWFEARMVFVGEGSNQVLTLIRNITGLLHQRPDFAAQVAPPPATLPPSESPSAA